MPNPPNELSRILQAFFHERLAAQRRASTHTVRSYRDTWKLLLRFLAERNGTPPTRLRLADLTAEAILAFLDHLETQRHCSVRTRNQRRAAIRAFFRYAVFCRPEALEQCQRVLQIPTKRFTRTLFGLLTREEMDAMLSAPERTTPIGRRHAALILFLYNTGARVSEATGLTVKQLRLDHPPHVRILGKGDKERVVPLWDDTAETLRAHITERGIMGSPDAPVFANRRGERLTRNGVAHILNRTQEKAAERCPSLRHKPLTPHTLRHTTAMHLLQSGVDLNVIRCWLGHAALDTTHQYVEADLEMKRQALAKGGIALFPNGPTTWKPTDEVLAFLETL